MCLIEFSGYLEFTRNLGFVWAHIWACPPSEGDDYIFHCHPPEQRVPKARRLQEWYKAMLIKAQERKAIVEFKGRNLSSTECSESAQPMARALLSF